MREGSYNSDIRTHPLLHTNNLMTKKEKKTNKRQLSTNHNKTIAWKTTTSKTDGSQVLLTGHQILHLYRSYCSYNKIENRNGGFAKEVTMLSTSRNICLNTSCSEWRQCCSLYKVLLQKMWYEIPERKGNLQDHWYLRVSPWSEYEIEKNKY